MKFFEDLHVGDTVHTPGRTITEADVMQFAGLTGDYNEIHTNEAFARSSSVFGRRVVHGLLGLSISHGLLFRCGWFDGTGLAFLAVNKWTFRAPVFMGDTVSCVFTVSDSRPSLSKGDRGVVSLDVRLFNQEGLLVQEGEQVLLVRKRADQE